MKIFYQIFIIFFAVLSFYIVKDDVISVVGNVSSYFNKSIENPIIKLTEKENVLPGKVDVPGALRVVDNFLTANNKITLSEDNVILLTNKYRKENGNLIALKENQKLNLSAEKKLQDMFKSQYFEHISPSKIGVGDLAEEVGYKYILIGENLAMGNFKDDASLLDAWVRSKGHRENIVNKNYTEIGVAVGKGNYDGKDIWMAVQHFGTSTKVCPSIDQVLYATIGFNQNSIKVMENDLVQRQEMINKGVVYEGSTRNEQIDIYNSLVISYNNLIKDTKNKIEIYNNQIRAFNICLLGYQ